MKKIRLTNCDLFALVDDSDYERVSEYQWFAKWEKKLIYVARQGKLYNGKYITIRLHRFIMNAQKGILIDHISRDALDNRRINLRFCTHAQNMANRTKHINNKSGYKGVDNYSRWRKEKPWRAVISENGKIKTIGCFVTKEEAALAYNKKAKELYGEFARLNILSKTT